MDTANLKVRYTSHGQYEPNPMPSTPRERRDLAKLFEAAPEMLAVLQQFDESFSENGEYNCRTADYSLQELLSDARAAIAKATSPVPATT
jgi:hypothetical protein